MTASRERGRPARTKPGTASAISPTRTDRQRRRGSIFFYLITHKFQPQLTGDRATEESAQRHERVEEPNQRVGSGG